MRSVDVYRTVFELKTKLETMVKIPANRMRLFYVDQVNCPVSLYFTGPFSVFQNVWFLERPLKRREISI